MRRLLPSVPPSSVLLSWLSIRPTSEQICMKSVKKKVLCSTLYGKSQYCLNSINNTSFCLNTRTKRGPTRNSAPVELKFPYPWEGKGKEETFTQDCLHTFEAILSVRCLTMSLWSKQAPVGFTNFLLNERFFLFSSFSFFQDKEKKAEEEECNQSRFVLDSITSFLTIRRVSERDIQM